MSLYKGNNLISGAMPNSANQSLSNLDSAGQDKFDEKANTSLSNLTSTSSTNFDGQWTSLGQNIITSSTSLNGSTNLTYTVNVPTDGYTYEVLLYGDIETGATSGNSALGKVYGAYDSTVSIGGVTTRTASKVVGSGSGTILVDSSRKIYLARSTNWNGACTYLKACAYRRMGSNS